MLRAAPGQLGRPSPADSCRSSASAGAGASLFGESSEELRIIRDAVPELTTTLIPKVEQLGELLGSVHDLHCAKATAELHPRWFGRQSDSQAVLAAVDERRAALEAEALSLAESVFAGRPRDVRALVKIGWRVWRRGDPEALADLPGALLH